MPRLPADIRIGLKKRGGSTYRIELVQQRVGERYWVRRDGKYLTTVPEATAIQTAEHIRRWLSQTPKPHGSPSNPSFVVAFSTAPWK